MDELKLPVRIALQNLIWKNYKITVPDLEKLYSLFMKKASLRSPQEVNELEDFITHGFGKYLEPINGFICTKRYSKEALEKNGIFLEKLSSNSNSYRDKKYNLYWCDFEGRYGETIGLDFVLEGTDPFPFPMQSYITYSTAKP